MERFAESLVKRQLFTTLLLWSLIVVYASARSLQAFPSRVPMLAIVALHVLPPLVFAFLHGAMLYGLRGILTFFALCVAIGGLIETCGVLTGFPFGHYYFTDVMGPKIFVVPIFLGLAYVGMGYLSWTLARVILGGLPNPLTGSRVVTLPLLAALFMVAWDLCMDPIWATVVRAWIWQQGGAYFGVPLSNFFGWYLTVYIIYQLSALYLRKRVINLGPLPSGYLQLAILFYGVSAAGNLLLLVPRPGLSQVTDATGKVWQVSSIVAACVFATIFTMDAFTVLAWIRLRSRGRTALASGTRGLTARHLATR
jgi:uncharacterized membrane protein